MIVISSLIDSRMSSSHLVIYTDHIRPCHFLPLRNDNFLTNRPTNSLTKNKSKPE